MQDVSETECLESIWSYILIRKRIEYQQIERFDFATIRTSNAIRFDIYFFSAKRTRLQICD